MTEPRHTPERQDQSLLAAWRGGDQSAAAVLFDRYLVRLTALARSRLSRRLARRVDPEDVVLSAYRSFFVAAADGRVAVGDGDDLWPLLVVLVLRKVTRNAERHTAARRSIERDAAFDSAILSAAIQDDPTPEQAALLDDELTSILSRLSMREREIVSRRLQGDGESGIATALGCSERTVRRAMERTRALIVAAGGLGSIAWPPVARALRPVDRARDLAIVPPTAEHDWPVIPYSDLQLRRLIGSGGMARLYLARWTSEGRDVAVKFLRKRFWRNSTALAGLLHEAGVLRMLNHPQIVTLLGSGRTSAGAPYLVLPWIDGEDFDAWRQRSQPGIEEVLSAMLSAFAAIAAAHAAGVVHCDLKPSNLLRETSGRVLLTDFGFSRLPRAGTNRDVRGGTAGFLSPEQCSDVFGEITVRTDVYGAGATLYALLCGRPPFTGADLPSVLAQVVSSRSPSPPSEWRADVPAWLDALVLRCLANEPADRFADVAEIGRQILGRGDSD